MNLDGRLEEADLETAGIHTVIVAGIDMYGRLTGKRIPRRRFKEVQSDGLHVCTCVYAWDFAQELGKLKVDYAGDHTGWHDFRLIPDMATLRRAAWLEGTAIVLADSVEEHSDSFVSVAPRTVLRRTVERMTAAGYASFAATELEFHLYKGAPAELRAAGYHDLDPTTAAHADYNIAEGDSYESFFRVVRGALEGSGVPIEVAQVEYGPGQWEINLEYGDPREVADRHVLFKHIVRHVAAVNGMTATFMPRPLTDGMGSSCHIHASLRDAEGVPLFHDPADPQQVAAALRHAVGGLLEHTPELMLWYAPTVNAMRRTLTQDFAGNGLTWGFDNRTTTCRVITGAPTATRLEMRLPGSDVNPYLALSAVLTSMEAGIRGSANPGPHVRGDGYQAAPAAHLPMTLGDAAGAFRNSALAREQFGSDVVEHYSAVAEDEWRSFLLTVSDWDRRRYFDSI
ncbi:MAG: glutamine synthetase [Blastococcus sp.]|jgi:glutamine synthetase|nr:glutamine synthetase [Blastococcus sp.]